MPEPDQSFNQVALSELSRHYDTTLWAVTGLWAAGVGGLLLYVTINLRTAKALGLTIPQTLLLRADHIIE